MDCHLFSPVELRCDWWSVILAMNSAPLEKMCLEAVAGEAPPKMKEYASPNDMPDWRKVVHQIEMERRAKGTTENMQVLVEDLNAFKTPKNAEGVDRLINLAKNNDYDDFCSPYTFPTSQLIADARAIGLESIATWAEDGRYDAVS